ncbi:hypothetical protein DFJ77DRAFT_479415 [Powellomyces hirtus]|nr:hypothetical protein DFJ77DRAFT_479415 [Powellomyces hirtus]
MTFHIRRPSFRLMVIGVLAFIFSAIFFLSPTVTHLVKVAVPKPTPTFYNACNHNSSVAVHVARTSVPAVHRRVFHYFPSPTCDWARRPTTKLTPPHASSVLLGVVTSADRFEKRRIIRNTYGQDARSSTRIVFVVGRQDWETETGRELSKEAHMYGDIMVLDIDENGDNGKTFTFFQTAATVFSSCPFTYVAKVDDDVWFHLPHLESRLDAAAPYAPTTGVYYGVHLDWMREFHYMAGMITCLSWNIVQWVATDPYAAIHAVGPEDVKTGQWVLEFGRQRAEKLGNSDSPFHNKPRKCPAGGGYPTYVCEPWKNAYDWNWPKDEIRGFNRTTVVAVHRLKEAWRFCEADALLGPR